VTGLRLVKDHLIVRVEIRVADPLFEVWQLKLGMHEPGKVNFFIFGFLLLGRIVIGFPVFFVTLVAYNFTFTRLVPKLKFIFAAKTESIALIEGRCRFTLEFFGRYHYLNLVQHIAAIGKLATIILLKMVSLNLVSLAEESSILTLI
jgi:hypothetical protein